MVTRQLTGAAAAPSSRLVSTASMTVPSSTRWSGPTALMRGVGCGFGRSPRDASVVATGVVGATCGPPGGGVKAPAVRDVARTTASAISSIEGSPDARRGSVDGLARPLAGVRLASLGTTAQHDVAGEQALVLAPLALCDEGVDRRCRAIVRRRWHGCRLGVERGLPEVARRLLIQHSQAVLIVAHPVRGGCRRGLRARSERGWSLRLAGQEDDAQHAHCQGDHQPRLHALGQHAARNRAAINDGRRAGGFDLVGHDYRSRRSNASLAVPSAR